MEVFKRIQNLAKQRDKSLQQVAEDLNFSKNLFYRWKTTSPKAEDLAKVAEYFKVTTDYLLGRTDEKYANLIEPDAPIYKDLSDLFNHSDEWIDKLVENYSKEEIKTYQKLIDIIESKDKEKN